MSGFQIRPAKRTSAKPLIGLYSESGGGKTWGALLIAKGFIGDMSKVVMIETESGRGEVYADDPVVGGYNVLSIADDYSPEKYGEAIDAVNKAGMQALIIDSASHEWEGVGGVLDMAAKNQDAGKKGQQVWTIPKITHNRQFILKLLGTPVPLVIVCMRAKYPLKEVQKQGGGKDMVRADVPEPKQSDDILYEMMVHGWFDKEHKFHRTNCTEAGLKEVFVDGEIITVETGKRLAEWAKGGLKPKSSAEIRTEFEKQIAGTSQRLALNPIGTAIRDAKTQMSADDFQATMQAWKERAAALEQPNSPANPPAAAPPSNQSEMLRNVILDALKDLSPEEQAVKIGAILGTEPKAINSLEFPELVTVNDKLCEEQS